MAEVTFLSNVQGKRVFPVTRRDHYRFDSGSSKVKTMPLNHAKELQRRFGEKVFRVVPL